MKAFLWQDNLYVAIVLSRIQVFIKDAIVKLVGGESKDLLGCISMPRLRIRFIGKKSEERIDS